MNRHYTFSALTCFAISTALVTGCGPTAPPPQPEQHDDHDHDHEHGDDHDHDHDHDGHDHKGEAGKADAHDHSSTGPNGGHLIELGKEDYHAELVHDEKQPSVSLFLLGADAKTPVAAEAEELVMNLVVDGAPKQFKLAAAPLSDEQAGTSRFQSNDESLWKLISGEEKLSGRFNISIDGKRFTGAFEHEAHDHEHDQAKSSDRAAR